MKSEHAILGDTSVPQSRKKRSVSQAGQLVSVKHEDQQDTAQLPAKKHKSGKATAASQKQKQLKKARGYLAERGIFAGAYMSAHSKTGILRGVSTCAVGGWSILLDKLVAGEVPKACAVCVDFLASKQLDIRGLMEAPDTGDVAPLQDEGTSAAGEEVDARALVLANTHLRLLPDGWGKKRTPVECLVCRRKSTGKLAVFDLSSAGGRKSYDQHVTGPTHVKNVALARSGAQTFQSSKSAKHAGSAIVVREPCEPGEHEGYESDGHQPSEPVALRCQGLHVQQALKGAKVAKLLPAFELWQLWVGYNVRSSAINLHAEDQRHAYIHDLSTGHYIITHHSCQKDAASIVETDVPPLCNKCMSLANDRGLVRLALRFYVKQFAAHLLAARLFEPDQAEELIGNMKSSSVYEVRSKELDEVCQLATQPLQTFVRSQFLSIPQKHWSMPLRNLMSALVWPCLKVSVSGWARCRRDAQRQLVNDPGGGSEAGLCGGIRAFASTSSGAGYFGCRHRAG